LEMLGARFLRGLNGTLEFPAGNGLATSSYNTETGSASETTPTTKKPTMTPKRQATWSKSTLQLINQASVDVASWLESEILDAEMRLINEVAILGGGSNQPIGILAMTTGSGNIGLLKIGPDADNGAQITRAHLLTLEETLANAYAMTNEANCKILTTNGVKRVLKNLPSADGIAPFVWENNNTVIGYNAYSSTHVPKTLDIGSTTGVGHALIMGDFSKLLVGQWGVRLLTVDNITAAKTGEIEIILNSFSDVQVIHKQAFAVIKDIEMP
jgi:HK97 family phage major capsid protein